MTYETRIACLLYADDCALFASSEDRCSGAAPDRCSAASASNSLCTVVTALLTLYAQDAARLDADAARGRADVTLVRGLPSLKTASLRGVCGDLDFSRVSIELRFLRFCEKGGRS